MNLLIVYSLPDLEHLNLLVLFILVVVHDVQFRQGKKPFASSSCSRGVSERSNVSARCLLYFWPWSVQRVADL